MAENVSYLLCVGSTKITLFKVIQVDDESIKTTFTEVRGTTLYLKFKLLKSQSVSFLGKYIYLLPITVILGVVAVTDLVLRRS